MNRDVETREDLEKILRDFYTRLLSSDELRPFFDKFREEHVLENHLKDLSDFWESALFYRGSYKTNVMEIHRKIDENMKISSVHFKAWLLNFDQAVDDLYKGQNSETMKARARSIATVMQIKFQDPDE